MVLFFFLLISLFFPILVPRGAAQLEEALPPVVVTATRTETPQQDVTTSISVITSKDIQTQQAETVLEALRDVPGVDVVQSGSRGNATSVFIRGSDSDHVLVLMDGVEVNSTTLGSFDFAHLKTDNIDRIEVLRGAGGTLYGSQAIGGVVNIITKKGEGPAELTVSAEGGNWSTHREALGLRGAVGDLGYSLSVSRLGTHGFHRFNDDYRNLSTSGRLDYQLTDDTSLKGIFRFVKTDLGLFNNNNFVPGNPGDPNAREAVEQYLGKLEWEQRIFKNWDYRISGSIFKEHDKDSDDPDSCTFFGFPCDPSKTRDRFRPQIDTGEFQTNYRYEDWSTTTFGAEYKLRQASTTSASDGIASGGINRAIRNVGYYFQEQIQLQDRRLILIPGVRLDDNQTFGTAWTPSFSAAYLFKETGTRLKGSYEKGFKAPTLNELFFPAGFGCPAFGNPNLSPEKSWELNAGIEQDVLRDRIKLGATYFHRDVKDLIEAEPIPGNPLGCFRAENVGRARFDGMEWSLGVKLLAPLTLNAQYTYLHWNTADGTLPRRPRHRGGVNLNYLDNGLNVNLAANIVGRRNDFRAAFPFGNTMTPGYVRVDLASSYALPWRMPSVKQITVYGKIENLLNQRYEEANGFRARPLNFLFGVQGAFGKSY
jgi:vitamin B12 transporter